MLLIGSSAIKYHYPDFPRVPKDIDYVVPFESVSVVQVSISEVVTTLLEALGLVVLVVFRSISGAVFAGGCAI